MARPARIDLPGVPQHLVVRGNNRANLFRDDNDRTVFIRFLRQSITVTDSDVHAFVLMTNHVHLLATGKAAGALSRLVQSVGRRYTRYVNRVHERTGTLFEGRFHASLVDSERYLFTCMRYIELNPVRAGMSAHAGEYAWSSFRQNSGAEPLVWLTPRSEYLALGCDAASRGEAYRSLFSNPIADGELQAIRQGIRKNAPLGASHFIDCVEHALGRKVEPAPRGRPKTKK
ncbi:MAG TPA: transposase [Usitatibacter sp.]|nr:transposase [Usitatibacter sp.]